MTHYRLKRGFFSWLLHHFAEHIWWYLGAFSSLVVLQYLQLQIPLQLKKYTDNQTDGFQWGVFVLLALGILLFRTASRLLFFTPARFQQKYLRGEFVDLLEKVPAKIWKNKTGGDLYQVLFNDLNNLRAFVGFALLQIGNVLVAGIILIPEILRTQKGLLIAITPLLFSVFVFFAITSLFQRYAKKSADAQAEVQNVLMEAYQARSTIKNFHKEEHMALFFKRSSEKEMSFFFKTAIGFAITIPLIRLGLGLSLIWGAWLVKAQNQTSSELIFFAGFLFLLLEPLMFLSWIAIVSAQGLVAWRRVKEFFHLCLGGLREEVAPSVAKIDETLSLKCLFWEKELTLSLRPQKWFCLVGPTGCGKSSLLEEAAEQLLGLGYSVSFVRQEPYLFNDGLENNLFLYRDVTPAKKDLALKLLALFGLSSLTENDESLLSLELGENGKRLSGGQAKRVALIRSLLSEAKIIVWDDPFSSVDVENEKNILRYLRAEVLFSDKIFILSTHRLITARYCDEVHLLDKDTKTISASSEGSRLHQHTQLREFFNDQILTHSPSV